MSALRAGLQTPRFTISSDIGGVARYTLYPDGGAQQSEIRPILCCRSPSSGEVHLVCSRGLTAPCAISRGAANPELDLVLQRRPVRYPGRGPRMRALPDQVYGDDVVDDAAPPAHERRVTYMNPCHTSGQINGIVIILTRERVMLLS